MVEVENRLLQEVLKKLTSGEENKKLAPATQQVNARVIQHLQVAPSAIFFGAQAAIGSLNLELAFILTSSIDAWVEEVTNPVTHFANIRKYRDYGAQTHDRIRQLAFEKKERDAMRYNAGGREIFHEVGSLVMVHQKKTTKLEPRWRGPFRIASSGGARGVSWRICQLNGRLIRGTYHGDHLKPFIFRQGYLSGSRGEDFMPGSQTVRKPRKRGRKEKDKSAQMGLV